MRYLRLSVLTTGFFGFCPIASAQTLNRSVLIDPITRFSPNYTLPNQTFPGLDSRWPIQPDIGATSYIGHGRLRGRKALITGGDSGIGQAIAIAYAREGADVAIAYLEEEQSDADTTIRLVEATGQRVLAFTGDLQNETYCAELVQQAANRLGGLDILVSHAGYGFVADDIANLTTSNLDRTFRTNVYAGIWLTRAAVPLLPPGSSIIFTSSVLASAPTASQVDYSASKAAISSITKSLSLQLGPRAIRVNAVAPGTVYTNFLISQGQNTTRVQNTGRTTTVVGRGGQPVEVVPLYVTLAESTTSFTTGSVWAAGGGYGHY